MLLMRENQLRLVVEIPLFTRFLHTSGGAGFLPSTVVVPLDLFEGFMNDVSFGRITPWSKHLFIRQPVKRTFTVEFSLFYTSIILLI